MMNTKMEEVDRKSDDCDLRVRKNDETMVLGHEGYGNI